MENRNQGKSQSKSGYGSPKRGSTSSSTYHKTMDDLEDSMESMPEYYQEIKEKTAELYEQSKDKILHFIEEKPITSLFIAGGVGLLLSILITNAASRKKD